MEAKERIIDEDEKLCCSLIGKYPFKDVRDVIDEACLHQDEISFPLGQQDGARKMVAWINEHGSFEECDPDTQAYFLPYRWIDEDDWQTYLKEWGIDE